jgi:predicted acylesterase/phospholipase RssA
LLATAVVATVFVVPAEMARTFLAHDGLFSHTQLYETIGNIFLRSRTGSTATLSGAQLTRQVEIESERFCRSKLPCTLVVSATDYLTQQGQYFYVGGDPVVQSRAKSLGYISIRDECPGKLVDIEVGTAALFPVMAPRPVTLKDGRLLRLIDGGFIHNNPVQVAVDLGATHILILKPSREADGVPEEQGLIGSVLDFLFSLIRHTQYEDLKAQEQVMSFLVAPESGPFGPGVGLLEFDGHFGGSFLPRLRPSVTLLDYLKQGEVAAASRLTGFREWSRGTFKLPPVTALRTGE